MQVIFSFFLGYFVIFGIQYYSVNSNPLIGNNIRNVNRNEFPFTISLSRIDNECRDARKNHVCTGSLISKRDIVTAEHCIIYEDMERSQILIGSNNLRDCEHFYIAWWISYDQWANIKGRRPKFPMNDVAHIRMIEELPNRFVPITFSNTPLKDLYGLRATVAGWGRSNRTLISPHMKTTDLDILSFVDCKRRVRILSDDSFTLDKRQILCTVAEPYVLLNDGDSGGPLLYNGELIGVNKGTFPVSLPDRHPSLINLHMAIAFYKTFLNEIMND